jgi:hypothetical protein
MIEPANWQAIHGDFDFDSNGITFHGEVYTRPASSLGSSSSSTGDGEEGEEEYHQVGAGLAMSDVRFSGGSIDASFAWADAQTFPSVQIVIRRNSLDGSMITAGVSGSGVGRRHSSKFIIRSFDGSEETGGWETLAETSAVGRRHTGRMALRVVQTGSVVDLYADGVSVLRHLMPTKSSSQCGLFCRASGDLRVSDYRVVTQRRSAFVVMQFGVPYDQLYADVIRPVVAGCGFDVIRADDDFGPGLIIADVVRRIQEAEVIIADITPENQNVFYEVGYAHALGKPTILLAEKGKRLPFDVSGFRTLFYENSIAGKAAVEQGLRRHVEAITRERPAALAV